MIGAAEAAAIEAIGKAEAERMRQKAAAYKQYGDAALMSLILEAMPKVIYIAFDVVLIYSFQLKIKCYTTKDKKKEDAFPKLLFIYNK